MFVFINLFLASIGVLLVLGVASYICKLGKKECQTFYDGLIYISEGIVGFISKITALFSEDKIEPLVDLAALRKDSVALVNRIAVYDDPLPSFSVKSGIINITIDGKLNEKYSTLMPCEVYDILKRRTKIAYEKLFFIAGIPVQILSLDQNGYRLLLPLSDDVLRKIAMEETKIDEKMRREKVWR